MNHNITRRITAAVAGSVVTAGIFAGITVATPAGANAAPASSTSCTTPKMVSQPSIGNLNPLTRAAQVQAISPSPTMRNLDVSCVSN